MNEQPLLSICIPTYNGANRINKTLDCIVNSIGDRKDIEVIVSDNCSTDNTEDIVRSYLKYPFLLYFRNEKNLGFNGNIIVLLDKYATGEYCWLLGDDDFIDQDAIENLVRIIKLKRPPYISLKHRCLTVEEFIIHEIEARKWLIEEGTYFHCIDTIASTSNVLGTFMSSHVFKLEPVRAFDKSVFKPNDWDTFMYVFPNSYMMAQCFYKETDCICVKNPVVTALIHSKAWGNQLNIIKNKILPDGLKYYKKLSASKSTLPNCRDLIYKDIIFNFVSELRYLRISKQVLREFFSVNTAQTVYHIIYKKIWKRF